MLYTARLNKARFEEDKTDLLLTVDEDLKNKIIDQEVKKVEINLIDPRKITSDQRKKAYATIRDIALWNGDAPEFLKEYFKFLTCEQLGIEYFSLSDCSVTTARIFINNLVDFALEWGVPLAVSAADRTDDIDHYLYKCLELRMCAITNRPGADIHHVDRVGMGRNRDKVDHSSLRLIALSREWHTKVHAEGEKDIFEKFKVHGIKVDKHLLKKLNLHFDEIS